MIHTIVKNFIVIKYFNDFAAGFEMGRQHFYPSYSHIKEMHSVAWHEKEMLFSESFGFKTFACTKIIILHTFLHQNDQSDFDMVSEVHFQHKNELIYLRQLLFLKIKNGNYTGKTTNKNPLNKKQKNKWINIL